MYKVSLSSELCSSGVNFEIFEVDSLFKSQTKSQKTDNHQFDLQNQIRLQLIFAQELKMNTHRESG